MTGNTFGRLFRLTTFGESHGPGLGGVIEGCPPGLPLDEGIIQAALDKRKPGASGQGGVASTARSEPDRIHLLSGIFEGKTTGTPIGFYVENTNQLSSDYSALAEIFRPGHADLGFYAKYGVRDPRGGGRSSGRETLCRVAGGAIAEEFLRREGITVRAWTTEIGGVAANAAPLEQAISTPLPYFAPHESIIPAWEKRLTDARADGDTLGGIVRVEAFGLPAGLGEPVFDKLDARLAYALMGVGAVKGVEIGAGTEAARMTGSENNDPIIPANDVAPDGTLKASGYLPGGHEYAFASNNAGGILGGISTGAPLCVTVAVKPIASISREQDTINRSGEAQKIQVSGRHDICAIPRIVSVLKAMTAMVLADFVLLQKAWR